MSLVWPGTEVWRNIRLVKTGVATSLCYLALAVFFLIGGDFSRTRYFVLSLAIAALLWLFWYGSRAVDETRDTRTVLIGFAAAFALAALLFPVTHFSDLPSYINIGWQQARYGLNPYVHPVAEVPDLLHDPMIQPIWLDNPCPYGFTYALLCGVLVSVGRGNPQLIMVLFKVVDFAACALIAYLIVATRGKLGRHQHNFALYLFLWNPLVVLEFLANAHNDILMAVFVMLAMYAAACESWAAVLPLLMAGSLIKYSCALIVPFVLVQMVRQRKLREVWLGGLMAAGVFLLSGAPYLGDIRNFRSAAIASNLLVTANSLESVFLYVYEIVVKPIPVLHSTIWIAQIVFQLTIWAAGTIVLLFQFAIFRHKAGVTTLDLIKHVLFAQFLLVCVISSKFYPWYVGGFFPLALVLERDHWLRQLIVLLSVTATLAFTRLEQAHIINYLVMVLAPTWWIAREHWRPRRHALDFCSQTSTL